MRGHILEMSTSDFETLLASIRLVVDDDEELELPRRDRDG
jgi:hypothetical protein